jgi:hypothetical protein
LAIVESEFAGALTVARRDGNILSRVLRDAWDRGDLATLTKSSPARATGAHVSLRHSSSRPIPISGAICSRNGPRSGNSTAATAGPRPSAWLGVS